MSGFSSIHMVADHDLVDLGFLCCISYTMITEEIGHRTTALNIAIIPKIVISICWKNIYLQIRLDI